MTDDTSGTVVLSVDAELGWGHVDVPDPPRERVEYARTGWLRLLDLLDEYRLPATWAVVGHLFLDDCDGTHAGHPAPVGWFEREVGAWADRPDLRFGQGLIERVETARADHELACHGFSHVPFWHPEMTPELARAEFAASREAAGRSFDSLVYPRNMVGYRDVAAEAGFTCYRGPTPRVPGTRDGRLAKLGRVLAGSPPIVRPHVDEHGLVNVPGSLPLFSFEGPAAALLERVVEDPIVRLARAGVTEAARTGGVFHAWLHPNNLYADRHARRLHAVFEAIAEARDDGRVTVEPMGAVADDVLDGDGGDDAAASPTGPEGAVRHRLG